MSVFRGMLLACAILYMVSPGLTVYVILQPVCGGASAGMQIMSPGMIILGLEICGLAAISVLSER